jgi:hypothetical protein
MSTKIPKRITQDRSYTRPSKTYQETLSNQEIKEKLKEYKPVSDIRNVSIGSHIRYISVDPRTKEKKFRLGGNLNKIDPEGRFVILSNGEVNWSVQISNTTFFKKMTEDEIRDEMKKELKKEILTEQEDDNSQDLKKELNNLVKRFSVLEKEYKKVVNENHELSETLAQIQKEIKKEKSKKK